MEFCGSNVTSLHLVEIKLKCPLCSLDVILLSATLLTIKIPGHSKLDFLEAKECHFDDISARNAALKGANQ